MLKGILSVSGQPGLFRLIAESKNRIIVESLITGKRLPVSTSAKISSLEDIAVYTSSGEVTLTDVFKKIFDHENGDRAIDSKASDAEIRKYFEVIIPDYDKDRVYSSDIKKVIIWYNLLQEKGLLVFPEETEETEETVPPSAAEETVSE